MDKELEKARDVAYWANAVALEVTAEAEKAARIAAEMSLRARFRAKLARRPGAGDVACAAAWRSQEGAQDAALAAREAAVAAHRARVAASEYGLQYAERLCALGFPAMLAKWSPLDNPYLPEEFQG